MVPASPAAPTYRRCASRWSLFEIEAVALPLMAWGIGPGDAVFVPAFTFAATGEKVDRETLGGAEMHSRVSCVTDYMADNDRHALAITRELVADFPRQGGYVRPPVAAVSPRYDSRQIYGIVSSNTKFPTDTREVLARLIDQGSY